jgi:2'-5' RNA ligase
VRGVQLVGTRLRRSRLRLFVAVELSAKLRAVLLDAQQRLGAFDRDVRWVDEENLHLTFKFLGDVMDGRVPEIVAVLERVLADCGVRELCLSGAGCFPPRGPVRVAWAGVADDGGAWSACRDRIDTALAEWEFATKAERFSPHVTLGRVRRGRRAAGLREAVAGMQVQGGQPVAAIALMQSTLTPDGPEYTRVASFPTG